MDDRVVQFRVGVLVVASCIITAILVVLFGEWPSLGRRQNTIHILFEQAPGVTIDTPVRKSGILIGRVSNVELRDDGTVMVSAKLDAERMPRRSEACRITSGNVLLGDAALEFVPGGDRDASPEYITDGAVIQGTVASSPLDTLDVITDVAQMVKNLEGDIRLAIVSIRQAGEEVNTVAQNLNAVVANNQSQFQRILQKTEQTVDRFDSSMESLSSTMGQDGIAAKLDRALESVPELLNGAEGALSAIQSMAERAEENLANLEGLTEPLGERGGELVTNLERSLRRIDELVANVTDVTNTIRDSEGSLGKFIHDPTLYDNINMAAENFQELTFRLRPILEDARIFTDKIARDPGRLGVKGALDRRQSGIKW